MQAHITESDTEYEALLVPGIIHSCAVPGIIHSCALPEGRDTFRDIPLGLALLNLSLMMFSPPCVLLYKGALSQLCSQFLSSSMQVTFLHPQGLEKHKGINLPNHPPTVLPWH